jgi:hypothetical protein
MPPPGPALEFELAGTRLVWQRQGFPTFNPDRGEQTWAQFNVSKSHLENPLVVKYLRRNVDTGDWSLVTTTITTYNGEKLPTQEAACQAVTEAEAAEWLLRSGLVVVASDETMPPSPPQILLTGWREITGALDMKYHDREKIKSLNARFNGPIQSRGQGTQPIVARGQLLEWWNGLAVQQQELANCQQGATLSGQAQHGYGRTGTVAPEIGGSVKRRRRRSTS